jgi:hypothetical protein
MTLTSEREDSEEICQKTDDNRLKSNWQQIVSQKSED